MDEPSPQQVQVKRVPGTAVGDPAAPTSAPHPRISTTRFVLAFIVAIVSDIASIVTEIAPPIQWIVDGVTAFLLFLLLGRRWQILPGLLAEAIPGLAALPFWILVVLAVFAADQRSRRASSPASQGK